MRKSAVATACVLVLGGLLRVLWALQLEPVEEIMWQKLDLSHGILDAIAIEDFEALEAHAGDLVSLSEASSWFGSESERYRSLAEDYRTAVLALQSAARDRDTDAAVFAYVDATLRCVRCHQELGRVPQK